MFGSLESFLYLLYLKWISFLINLVSTLRYQISIYKNYFRNPTKLSLNGWKSWISVFSSFMCWINWSCFAVYSRSSCLQHALWVLNSLGPLSSFYMPQQLHLYHLSWKTSKFQMLFFFQVWKVLPTWNMNAFQSSYHQLWLVHCFSWVFCFLITFHLQWQWRDFIFFSFLILSIR